MKIDKVKDTYGDYKVTLTYGQLIAIRKCLKEHGKEPISDELVKELEYYLDKLPKPGVDEDEEGSNEEGENSDEETTENNYFDMNDINKDLESDPSSKEWGKQSNASLNKTKEKDFGDDIDDDSTEYEGIDFPSEFSEDDI